MDYLLNDLRRQIEQRSAVLFIGAGVSIATTNRDPLASWIGLLEHGVNRCCEVVPELPPRWNERTKEELHSGDLDDLLSVAQKVTKKLSYPRQGEYTRWLEDTVGALRVENSDLIKSLIELKIPVATTNYDSLIETVTGLVPITWRDRPWSQGWLRGEPGILHMHGYWRTPDSVVLGIPSYEEILHDDHAIELLRSCFMTKSVIFVGFGAGLEDPNFSALLQWSKIVLAESKFRHYRLARQSDVQELQRQHSGEQISVISFGQNHPDLSPFLRDLAASTDPQLSSQTSVAVDTYRKTRIEVDRRLEALDERKPTLSLDVYFDQLIEILNDLRRAGGIRSSSTILASAFHQGRASLQPNQRINVGLQLAEMMSQDDVPEEATRILTDLNDDIQTLPEGDTCRARFWQIQSKCFAELGAFSQAAEAIQQSMQLTPDVVTVARLKAELAELCLLQGQIDGSYITEGVLGRDAN